MKFVNTLATAAAAVSMLGVAALPASASTMHRHHYSAAQRQAYNAGYQRGFARGHMAAAYGAEGVNGGLATGRSVGYDAGIGYGQPGYGYGYNQGVYGGPFSNGGLLGTGLFNGGGVLGTGVFGGQGALGLGVLGF